MNRRNFLAVAVGTALFAALPAFAYTSGATYSPTKRTRGTAVLNVKNYGALGNGVHDDTAAIQAAINALPSSGGTVYIPAGTYMIDTTKNIRLRSYMLLSMDPAAILKAKTNSAIRSYVLYLNGLTQVEVAGGQIAGDRATHHYVTTSTSEWNHGIQINGGSHITIRDLWTGNNAGDGICCGGGVTDLEVVNIVSTNNRRQGFSITHAYSVKVYDSEFSYTNGTAPQHGIDVEPDSPSTCSDVLIQNCNLHHNAGVGIEVHQRVSRTVIKNNLMQYNTYGVYTGNPNDHGEISGNTIEHNRWCGVYFSSGTTYYSVFGNTFANNRTNKTGVKMNLGSPVAKTGMSTTNIEGSSTSNTVGSNYYCTAT
jgi:hypothetical protein